MTATTSITCNQCGKGVNYHYRTYLELAWCGHTINRIETMHFCDQRCLAQYFANYLQQNKDTA